MASEANDRTYRLNPTRMIVTLLPPTCHLDSKNNGRDVFHQELDCPAQDRMTRPPVSAIPSRLISRAQAYSHVDSLCSTFLFLLFQFICLAREYKYLTHCRCIGDHGFSQGIDNVILELLISSQDSVFLWFRYAARILDRLSKSIQL